MELRALVVDDESLARDELCFHLAQADGEDVVERGLVDVGQQSFDVMFAVPGAVGGGEGEFLALPAVGRTVEAQQEFSRTLQIAPDFAPARQALARFKQQ